MKRRKKKKSFLIKWRVVFLSVFFISLIGFVGVYRVLAIKTYRGDEFEKKAIENQINKVSDKIINPNRGSILDRNDQPLAISSTVFNVALDIRLLEEIGQKNVDKKNEILKTVSEVLDIDMNKLNSYFEKDSNGKLKPENDTHWKIIKKKIDFSLGKTLESKGLKGVNLEEDTKRSYPQNNLAAQTIGFIKGDTKWGLESTYDSYLTGTPGRIYRTYDNRNAIITNDIAPKKGNDIITTLDLTLQQYAEEIVANTYKKFSPKYTPEVISLILMNPKTGEILSMAQYPDFNLNNPADISLLQDPNYKASFEKMSEDEKLKILNSVWKNFAITDAFEPGSTFKAITVAAALEEGLISENETFYCSGYRQVANYKIRCHKRTGHGKLNLTEALEKSCNMAMLDLAEKLGRDKFYKYQRDFGIGYRTGIDLLGEVKADSFVLPVQKLNVTELATSAFGQTFTATPIQIITSFAATINGGNILEPYIVSQIIDENGIVVEEKTPKIVRKVISQETSDFLRNAMIQTLEQGGTAYKANIPGYKIGGKTATAQQGKRSDNIYTLGFAAYMPADDPEYLALATIHKPKDYDKAMPGEVSPVPMIKEFFEKLISYKAIPPSKNVETNNKDTIIQDRIILKDYTNKPLKDVIKQLNIEGIDFQLVGGGGDTVTKQIPPPNTPMDKNGKLLLYIETKGDEKSLISVPDTKNLNVEEAMKILKELGFEVVVDEVAILENLEKENNLTNAILEETTQETTISTEEIEDIAKQEKEEEKKEKKGKKVFEQIPEAGVFIQKGSIVKIKIK